MIHEGEKERYRMETSTLADIMKRGESDVRILPIIALIRQA